MHKFRCAVMASGQGSNAERLAQAFFAHFIPASLIGVICNVVGAPVVMKMQRLGLPVHVIDAQVYPRDEVEHQILQRLQSWRVNLLLLAGYNRLLSPFFLQQFPGDILNIHPSLLPEFRGERALYRQFVANRRILGATVHFVDAGIDTGAILLQGSLVKKRQENFAALQARLQKQVEHIIYPRAIKLYLERQRASLR